jgi:tetratricopeptide (TPR) repeat protein
MKRRAVALAFLAAAFVGGRAEAACHLDKIVDLPVTMAGLRPIVTVKINGADVPFLADTGAFFSMITAPNAAQLHLPTRAAPPYFYVTGVDGDAEVSLATVRQMFFAGVPIPNVLFIVGGGEMGAGSAGLLGENVLGIADGEYDLANGLIRLFRPDGCQDLPLAYWDKTQPYSVVDIKGPDHASRLNMLTPSPTATALVNGQKVKVTFDTGASTSIISLAAAARAGVTPKSPGVTEAGYSSGIGRGRVRNWIAQFASFKVGDEEIKNVKMRIGDFASNDIEMLLGDDFFLSHHIYVANSQRKLYFTYNGGPVFNLASTQRDANAAPQANPNIGSEPKDAESFARRGQAFEARREYAKAIDDLTHAVTLAPGEHRYLYERGLAYAANKQPFLAMQDFDAALKLKPDDIPALVARAQMRLSGRDQAGAIADLDAVDGLAAKEADVRLTLGGAYLRADRFAQAIQQDDLWIPIHPDDHRMFQALNQRCWARAQAGTDLQKALADCDRALRLNTKFAAAFDSRGLVRLRLGDDDGAITDYDQALSLDPKLAWSLYGRGLAKLKKGATAEGQSDIAAATALQSNLPEVAKARGLTP